MNRKHQTPNTKHQRTSKHLHALDVGCWMLDVGCSLGSLVSKSSALTPALSPRRGRILRRCYQYRARLVSCAPSRLLTPSAGDATETIQVNGKRRPLFPLPKGEGKGEGEGSIQIPNTNTTSTTQNDQLFEILRILESRFSSIPVHVWDLYSNTSLYTTSPSPSPRPSPLGRGRILRRCYQFCSRSVWRSFSSLVLPDAGDATRNIRTYGTRRSQFPLLGGEGQGEGGQLSYFPHR
jgi:hypothetical protein